MNVLQVSADSPWLVHAGAATILYLHIAGGTFGILSGTAALVVRKGSRLHALAGNVFFVSMLVMASIGAAVAPFLKTAQGAPKLFDALAGLFTCYLVATGWMTVRRKAGTIGAFEKAACIAAFLMAAGVAAVGIAARNSADGLVGGYPATPYFVVAGIVAVAAMLDLRVVLSGGLTGVPRLSRHVWRIGLAFWVAVGSFFLGQQRVMPEAVQGSLWLTVPPLAAMAAILFWLVKLRLSKLLADLRRRRGGQGQASEDRMMPTPTSKSVQYG